MHRRVIQAAAAAAVVIGIVSVVAFWPGGNGAGSIAWADVRRHIEGAKTICYKLSLYRDGNSEGTADVKYMPPGRMRSEMPGMICIFDWQAGRILVLGTESRTAHETVISDMENPYHRDWLEDLKKIIGSDSAKEVGEKEIAGRRAKGWQATEEDWLITIWADAKTAALLQADLEVANTKMVMSDFEFDRELDESLFSLTPPKGYTVTPRLEIETSDPSEKDLLMLLRVWAMVNQDVFPDRLDAAAFGKAASKADWRRIGIRLGMKSQEESAALSQAIGRAFALLYTWGHEWSYVGKGVRLGEKDKPVFWYRAKTSKTYCVIYGDLSVKDVAPEDLPKRPEKQAETRPAPSGG